MLYTSKESSEHVKCRFRLKKYDLLLKKWKKLILKKKISKGGPFEVGTVEKKNFRFSNFQNFFLKNGFNGTWQMLIETKSWNLSSFRASTEKSREIICQGWFGSMLTPQNSFDLTPPMSRTLQIWNLVWQEGPYDNHTAPKTNPHPQGGLGNPPPPPCRIGLMYLNYISMKYQELISLLNIKF